MQKFFFHLRKNDGYTLVELLVALSTGMLLSILLLNTVTVTAKVSNNLNRYGQEEEAYKHLHLYLQKQILKSSDIKIKGGTVYFKDMETPQKYYNFYRLNESAGILYRVKTDNNLREIGLGEASQLASNVVSFSLEYIPPKGVALQMEIQIDEKVKVYRDFFTYRGEINEAK